MMNYLHGDKTANEKAFQVLHVVTDFLCIEDLVNHICLIAGGLNAELGTETTTGKYGKALILFTLLSFAPQVL